MSIFRLLKIISVIFRFGLDEIVLSRMQWNSIGTLWNILFFWRSYKEPRAIRLRKALEALGPIFVKFGQTLSTRKDLFPSDITKELERLQDRVPPVPFPKILKSLENSYQRPIGEVFSKINEEAIGSASVAQVHKAQLLSGKIVAVKILRPNVGNEVKKDIWLMKTFAFWVEYFLPDGARLKPRAVVATFEKHLEGEINLKHEAANCDRLRNNFKDSEIIIFPEVYWDFCEKEVMVMEFLNGVPINNIAKLKELGIDNTKLARIGIEIFFTQVFRDSFFHADMHPGNIHVSQDGRYIALDFGIVGHLSNTDKNYLARNFIAFFNRDYRKVAEMHIEAGWVPSDTSIHEFETELHAVCEPIFSKPLKDISFGKLLLQLFQTARKFNLEIQPQLILLQKTLLNIEGIGRQLDPDLNLWTTAKPLLDSWAQEQYSSCATAKKIYDKAPQWIEAVESLPRLITQLNKKIENEDCFRRQQLARHTPIGLWKGIFIVLIATLIMIFLFKF